MSCVIAVFSFVARSSSIPVIFELVVIFESREVSASSRTPVLIFFVRKHLQVIPWEVFAGFFQSSFSIGFFFFFQPTPCVSVFLGCFWRAEARAVLRLLRSNCIRI